jgi:hypothetical protein
MNIPLHTLVWCTDGGFGHTTCLIVNPVNDVTTHFVVNDRRIFGHEHIVPISFISKTTQDTIIVNCDRAALVHLPIFNGYEFDRLDDIIPYREDHVYWPIVLPDDSARESLPNFPRQPEQVPIETLNIRRNMSVFVTAENDDGERTDRAYFGQVRSFLANAHTGHITHLIVFKNRLWGSSSVTIPIASLCKVAADEILLNLTEQEVEALPSIQVKKTKMTC